MKNVWHNGDPNEICVTRGILMKNVWHNGVLMKNVWYNGAPDEKRVVQPGS